MNSKSTDYISEVKATAAPAKLYYEILAFTAGTLWSFGGLIVHSIRGATEWQVLFIRAAAIALFVFVVLLVRRTPLLKAIRSLGPLGSLAALSKSASTIAMLFALSHGTVASVLLIISSSPFWAALLGRILIAERIRWPTVIAMVSASFGILIMVSNKLSGAEFVGIRYAFLAVVFYALYSVLLRSGKKGDMLPTLLVAETSTAVVSAATLFLTHVGIGVSIHDLLLAVTLGVASSGIGTLLFITASKNVPAAELTLLALSEIALGPIWVWLFLNERPDPYTLVGGLFILAALVGNAIFKNRRVLPVAV
jgi:DME family drug/metabolite transporter